MSCPQAERSYEKMCSDALKSEMITAERSRLRAKNNKCYHCGESQGYRGAVLTGYRNVVLCGKHLHEYWNGDNQELNEKVDERLVL